MVNGDLSKMVEEELQRRGGYANLESGLMKVDQGTRKDGSYSQSFEPSDGKGLMRNQYARSCCFLCTSSFTRWIVVLIGLSFGLYLYSGSVWNGWAPPGKESDGLQVQNQLSEESTPSDTAADLQKVKLVVNDEADTGLVNEAEVEVTEPPTHDPINNLPPLSDPANPAVDTAEPVVDTAEPVVDTTEATADATEPAVDVKPTVDKAKPVVGKSDPEVDAADAMLGTPDPALDTANSTSTGVDSVEGDELLVDTATASTLVDEADGTPVDTDSTTTAEISEDVETPEATTEKLSAVPKNLGDVKSIDDGFSPIPMFESVEETVATASKEGVAKPGKKPSSQSTDKKILGGTLDLRRPGGESLGR